MTNVFPIDIARNRREANEDWFPNWRCDSCRDRGWVVDLDSNRARRCECRTRPVNLTRDQLIDEMASAGMGHAEIDWALDPWDGDIQPAPEWLWRWSTKLADHSRSKTASVVLVGDPGQGKTKACGRAALEYLRAGGRDLCWVRVREAAETALEERASHMTPVAPIEHRIRFARFVVLDDLGQERADHASIVDAWICWRIARGTPLLASTNDARTAEQRSAGVSPLVHMEGRIGSRLAAGVVRSMTGPDYRALRRARGAT